MSIIKVCTDKYHSFREIAVIYLNLKTFISYRTPGESDSKINTMIGKLTATEIQEVLTKNTLGRIGCNDGFNTYIIPVNYVYDGKYIFCHSQLGMKIKIMRQNPKVCFEVDEIIHFSNWKSVVAQGEYQELIKERDRYNAMQFFINKMLHVKISETAKPDEMYANPASTSALMQTTKPIIYRIFIEETSGRFEKDQTWAD